MPFMNNIYLLPDCIYLLEDEFDFRAAFFRFLENLRREYFSPHSSSVQIHGVVFLLLFFQSRVCSISFKGNPLSWVSPKSMTNHLPSAEGSANRGRR